MSAKPTMPARASSEAEAGMVRKPIENILKEIENPMVAHATERQLSPGPPGAC